jgi:hypothetical protein
MPSFNEVGSSISVAFSTFNSGQYQDSILFPEIPVNVIVAFFNSDLSRVNH